MRRPNSGRFQKKLSAGASNNGRIDGSSVCVCVWVCVSYFEGNICHMSYNYNAILQFRELFDCPSYISTPRLGLHRVIFTFSHKSKFCRNMAVMWFRTDLWRSCGCFPIQHSLADIKAKKSSKMYESVCITHTVYLLHVSATSMTTFRELHYKGQTHQNITRVFLNQSTDTKY